MSANRKTVSLMLDCSRNAVPNLEFLKSYIEILSKCGYNQLQLYMEDTYKIEGEKYFGYFRGGYTREELKDLDDFAYSKGIELIPAIQVLGHLSTIFLWGEYAQVHDTGDCLLVGEEKTYELIDKMIKETSITFRSKKINVGMDESFLSGKGEYLKRHDYKKPDEIFLEHLCRVSEILKKYDREGMMWGDMFYRNMNNGEYYSKKPIVSEKTKKLIPSNINIIYWDYYTMDKDMVSAMAQSALSLDKYAYFAGGVWSWVGFMPRCDFAIKQSKVAVPACKEAGIKNFITTAWGDNGAECSKLAFLPSLFYFAKLVEGNTDETQIKEEFFTKFGVSFDDLMSLKDLNDLEGRDDRITNVCKYMLYNDILAGIYDNSVDQNKVKLFTSLKEKYAKLVNNPTFGYVFKTARDLASVLEIKYDLGVRIRKAYKENNKRDLKNVINDLEKLIIRLEIFYETFKYQWYKENNLEGFEIQTNRIGGLILRCKEAKDLLSNYVSGKINKIHTLEQEVYIFDGQKQGEDLLMNTYSIASSINTH